MTEANEDAQGRQPEDATKAMQSPAQRGKNLFYSAAPEAGDQTVVMQSPADADNSDIVRVLNIPLSLHVELGSRSLRIRDILDIQQGSIVELEASANSKLVVYANNTPIARGEAVLVGKRYGVRITEVVSPQERMRRLNEGGHLA